VTGLTRTLAWIMVGMLILALVASTVFEAFA
jgi:hypothetical protein